MDGRIRILSNPITLQDGSSLYSRLDRVATKHTKIMIIIPASVTFGVGFVFLKSCTKLKITENRIFSESKTSVYEILISCTIERKADAVFKFLRCEECFRKALFGGGLVLTVDLTEEIKLG